MDLFVVDRYMGDDTDKQSQEANESKKLSLFKTHIENRKRDVASLNNSVSEGKTTSKKGKHEGEAKRSVKSKKKRTSSPQRIEEHELDQNVEQMQDANNEPETSVHGVETVSQDNLHSPFNQSGFTVIGGQMKKKEAHNVKKTLPDWLAKPNIIETDLSSNLLSVEELKCLSTHIRKRLTFLNIKSLFPVQKAVIPAVLDSIHQDSLFCVGGDRPSDICVSAPTGSGKTLSYVIPIVQTLANQPVCLLQALVLVPTKDLACQVKQVFEAFVEGTNLRVGLACGNKALAKEQESLIGQGYGSSSRINILVATPGRLVDHLSSTSHFTLQHLRYLVIDEADRLLDQSYHDWLNRVLSVAYQHHGRTFDPRTGLENGKSFPYLNLQTSREPQTVLTPAGFARLYIPLQKMLFSATMTNSPEKLAPLQLHNPVLYIASKVPMEQSQADPNMSTDLNAFSRYTVPHGLQEFMIVCNSGEKPLMLLYLIKHNNLTGVLCFTSSLEATHRLHLLVNLFGGIAVAEYSSSLNAQQRHGILRDFRQGQIQLLICSDAMARGMDIDNVSYVISYDAPKYVKTYIHRVGRTARAGNKGTAYTLLHSEHVHHFKELIQKTGREKIPKHAVKDKELQPLMDKYRATLEKLEEAVKREKQTSQQGSRLKGQEEIEKCLKQQLMKNIKA
ncbi:hypothetical protein QZH41_017396 [Actinostola sp. cb2023]|nr:hypothetical protein QZH41_017396 [Actinostola sp. cb2023]